MNLMAILGSLGLFMVGGVLLLMAKQSGEGFARNSLYGIRTKATMASDAAWEAGHRAAAPAVRTSAWIALVFAVLLGATALIWPQEEPVPVATVVLWIAGYVQVMVSALIMVRIANGAARAAEAQQVPTA